MHRAGIAAIALTLALLTPRIVGAEEPDALSVALAVEDAFVRVAETAKSGVVTLMVSGSHVDGTDVPSDPRDLEDYLRRQRPDHHPFNGTGSGFIVSEDGTIYTNAHVVDGADTIEVIFPDGRRGKADVIGTDEGSDVAVLRLIDPPKDLAPLPLADSDQVRVGQFAIAFGSPLELAGSFTVGHVSALHRNDIKLGHGPGDTRALRYQDFIQVDTPINPGNSGGPLLDIRGRVIGINTATSAGGDGIGFSIPINMALGIAGQLAGGGKVRRAYLGVRMTEMDPDLVELYGLDLATPVIINGIEPGSPAEAGRFMEQDIVLEFAGLPINSRSDLVNAIANAPIGEEVEATVYRTDGDEGRLALTVVLIEQSERSARREPASFMGAIEEEGSLLESHGLAFSEAPQSSKRAKGAVITRVRKGSAADEAGLRAGDVITQVEETVVTNSGSAVAALRGSKRPFIPMKYERDGDPRVTSIERPRR